MDTCYQTRKISVRGILSASALFVALFIGQASLNVSHAAITSTDAVNFKNTTQLAYWWGPGPYDRGYYQRHYWSGWHPGPGQCQQRCLHNRWTGAVARCERVCN